MIPSSNPTHVVVRRKYGSIAAKSGCGPNSSCCGGGRAGQVARGLGYTDAELATLPEEANLGLSCGNPTALAGLQPGETVLDLGSGAGLDVFLAAQRVGPAGKVIGVDMTPEMLEKARRHQLPSAVPPAGPAGPSPCARTRKPRRQSRRA